MRIKRIGILWIILLLTGCTVNYELELEDNGIFKETITGTVTNEELDNDNRTDLNIYSYNLNFRTPLINEEKTYNKSIIDKDEYKEYKYTYTFKNNYASSSAINMCYENSFFSETDEVYYINLSGKFDCLYSEKITVNLRTDYTIIENNADKINGNTYTWEITSNDNEDIHIAISKNIKDIEKYKEKKSDNTWRITAFVILVVLSIITYILYKKKNDSE